MTEPETAAVSDELVACWRAQWPVALAAWSKYTRLREPAWCRTHAQAEREGLSGSFAMIRLLDQRVVVDLQEIEKQGLADYAPEVLAHEIGHHVLAPGNVTDHVRVLARIRAGLPTLEAHAPMMANLYTDLLINDRLQRQAGLRMADIYRHIAAAAGDDPLWALYMGIYEELWQLDRGSLGGATRGEALNDAWLGARLIRVYAGDWLRGAGRFAALVLRYLVERTPSRPALVLLHDTADAADGAWPSGVIAMDADEAGGVVHPAFDPAITGDDPVSADASPGGEGQTEASTSEASAAGQMREPYEYGELLRDAGIKLSDHDVAMRYYRERALADLVPFPTRRASASAEPQMEGLETWQPGEALEDIDWLQSVLQSPRVIPGVTTVRRVYGHGPGNDVDTTPVDLDMYVDSSGSMPNPQRQLSWPALAGAIIALSALRTGARVQATLWSGKAQVAGTEGFTREEDAVLRVLTSYFGGGTCFPIHRLRDTYAGRGPSDRAVHILQISDDGISTMFGDDEQGNNGRDVAAMALARGRAGGTMALDIPVDWETWINGDHWLHDAGVALRRARDEQGWAIHPVAGLEQLADFARAFAQRHYGDEEPS